MAYDDISELPDIVTGGLPKAAQELFREMFNEVWLQYSEPYQHKGENDRETVAKRAAWTAVKRAYYKDDTGRWRPR